MPARIQTQIQANLKPLIQIPANIQSNQNTHTHKDSSHKPHSDSNKQILHRFQPAIPIQVPANSHTQIPTPKLDPHRLQSHSPPRSQLNIPTQIPTTNPFRCIPIPITHPCIDSNQNPHPGASQDFHPMLNKKKHIRLWNTAHWQCVVANSVEHHAATHG